MKQCPYCHAPMPNARRVQCGAPDCRRAWKRDYMRQYQRDWATSHGEWWGAEKRSEQRKSNLACIVCGEPVGHGQSVETRCRDCHHPRRTARDRALQRLGRAARGTAGVTAWTSGRCWSCGDEFVSRRSGRFCSRRCSHREKSATRRALTKGCKVTTGQRYAVYERDGWICQICGDLVNRAARVPDLDAAVIDHRTPLAQGGEHGPGNWQTAHFYCNSVKRDQVGFEFAEVAA